MFDSNKYSSNSSKGFFFYKLILNILNDDRLAPDKNQ